MKRSGIIRKIDTLGRIVIPREIRKLLNINTLDNMEIFVNENNEVVLKRTNVDYDLESYALTVGDKIYSIIGEITYIVYYDKVLKVYGVVDEGKTITSEVLSLLNKKHYTSFNGGKTIKITEQSRPYYAEILMPIIKDDRVIGGIILASEKDNFDINHLKFLRLSAMLLELNINEK